jgi:hypothetical protein
MQHATTGEKCLPTAQAHIGFNLHKALLLILFGFLATFAAPKLHAQAAGSFQGRVLDKSGLALPNATVSITEQATGLARDTKTDANGHYIVPLLPVGIYDVRVDDTGFQSAASPASRSLSSRSTAETSFS